MSLTARGAEEAALHGLPVAQMHRQRVPLCQGNSLLGICRRIATPLLHFRLQPLAQKVNTFLIKILSDVLRKHVISYMVLIDLLSSLNTSSDKENEHSGEALFAGRI